MKTLFSKIIIATLLLFPVICMAQSDRCPGLITPVGKNAVFYTTFPDSTGTHYSLPIDVQGYIPQDTSFKIPVYISATGTADSIVVSVIGRMIVNDGAVRKGLQTNTTGGAVFTNFVSIATLDAGFTHVDGNPYLYWISVGSLGKMDQLEIKAIGKSTNRANVVLNVIVVLTKQFGIFKVQ